MRSFIRNLVREILWRGALRKYCVDKPFVIAVGGSVGKTSAKEALAIVLAQPEVTIVKTLGNLATDFGVALSLLGFSELPNGFFGWSKAILVSMVKRPKPSKNCVYVLEYSVDSVGDTEYLTNKIKPNAVVMTAITPVHMEQFGTVEKMQAETVSLISPLTVGEKVYANWNDPVQRHIFTKEWLSGRDIHWYGVLTNPPKQSGTWATHVQNGKYGLAMEISFAKNTSMDMVKPEKLVETRVLAEYQLGALLAAAAVAFDREIPEKKIIDAVQKYELPAGRGRLLPGHRGITIIDDSANSSPEAVIAGLHALQQYSTSRKRRAVAIIGSMNELGASSDAEHERVAREAVKAGAVLLAVGPRSQKMVKAAHEAGAPDGSVMSFLKPDQLMRSLDQVTRRGDVIFVKASQNGMFLERVVKLLMAEPERAAELLVRQGKVWSRRHS